MEDVLAYNPRWKTPLNVMVVGPALAGKTTFIYRLLRHCNWLMDRPPKKIVYCYGAWQPLFEQIRDEFKVQFVKGLPENPYEYFTKPEDRPGLILLDDLMSEMSHNAQVEQCFTKGTHHYDVTLVALLQNVFPKGMRTASINSHILVLFPNPRDKLQIQTLARQAFPGQWSWVKRALTEVKRHPYEPIVLDFQQQTPDAFRIRTDLFPEDLSVTGHPFSRLFLP